MDEPTMTPKRQLYIGALGAVVTALCCFTPILVVSLGALGLSAWLAWLDFVLLPLLVFLLAVTVIAFIRLTRARQRDPS
jgi:mercuric ion transport protein